VVEGLFRKRVTQLQTFAVPDDDPGGWSVAIGQVALVPFADLMEAESAAFDFYPVAANRSISIRIPAASEDEPAGCARLP
jgi:hypothetical protein